ncbi:Preprotein translocase subunit SCY2, chloroplastic [Vitis vinifera]|uniref:Preprotein translocase subunit SCY2, chloroplastic n=1 Tax=Vitis vinifera TaxID=29760 RepID=A0A438KIA2_VITVI|nr:Preprotein translocase subunit SCY2, chloroplastic [Vitis vinifera]
MYTDATSPLHAVTVPTRISRRPPSCSSRYKVFCHFLCLDCEFSSFYHSAGGAVSWWPYILAVLGVFTIVTMWAVVVTEGCRKIKLQYYGFKLASATRDDSPITEVEPYIPFNINPSGMQPVLTTAYLLAFPSILARLFHPVSTLSIHVIDLSISR